MKINEILGESERLRLRVANLGDVDYILELCYTPENRAYILAFDRVHHEGIVAGDGKEAIDVRRRRRASASVIFSSQGFQQRQKSRNGRMSLLRKKAWAMVMKR